MQGLPQAGVLGAGAGGSTQAGATSQPPTTTGAPGPEGREGAVARGCGAATQSPAGEPWGPPAVARGAEAPGLGQPQGWVPGP